MENTGQLAHADAGSHDDRHFVDHLAGSRRYDGGAENLIAAFPHMDFDEALVLTVGDRAVDVLHHHRERLYRDGSLPGLPCMQSDVRDFRIAVGAPGNHHMALLFSLSVARV